MGRKAKARKEPRSRSSDQALIRPTPNRPLLALALLGCGLAGYLWWTSWSGQAVQGCSAGSGCDVVLSSRWATLLGLPTAFWGFITYLGLAGTSFIRRADSQWRLAWTLACLGTVYSLYLTTISIVVLGGTCPYCLTSLALMTATLVLVTIQRPELRNFSWQRWLSSRATVPVALTVFLHLNYVGLVGKPPEPEDPALRALAVHVADYGATMYGAWWCSHCEDQKAMFGGAARRLPYIECATGPQGSPQTRACNAAGISTYPTWEIDGRRYPEVLTPSRLAELTGFDLAAAQAAATR
jgi:uncharacterized membrane protein